MAITSHIPAWGKSSWLSHFSYQERPFTLIALCFIVVIASIIMIRANARRTIKINSLGSRSSQVPSWVPLQLDVLFTATRHLMRNTFFEYTQELLNHPGHTIEFNIFGRRILMTDAPENIKTIMATNFSIWPKGHHMHGIWSNVLGDSIFTTDGPQWLASKTLLRGNLAKSRTNDLELTEIDFQELKKHLVKDEPQDLYDLTDRYQLDVVTRVFLGKSADSLPSISQSFRRAMENVFDWNTKRIFLGPIGTLIPMNIVAGKSLQILNDYINTFVERVKAMSFEDVEAIPENDRNLVHTLIREEKDPKAVKDQLLAVLTAAKDPSSMTMAFAIYELARNPDVAAKLQEEISRVCGLSNLPTAAQIQEMTYAKCVMKETLRMYHSLGFNMRTASVDTSLPVGGGVNGNEPVGVPADTQCIYSVLGLQRRTDVWGPDAEVWKPERWLSHTAETWSFIPFNHGPRVCLGRVFGQQQVLYLLVRLYQVFDRIELISPKQQQIKVELNTKMAYPCLCKFYLRQDSKDDDKELLV
ncbi:Cytochrome P450 [Glarea lozoyensis ATCC 20868]|uniref:Cytochrome P450 n=1 Tax=Glarea lozoyensis (strain ATCC 20868 / MF5171) TaxID=1116229 RepID=S3DDS4_GLAL2|nr:Cytochrome P450 [Glarea lozoyensis ATCC 20868]EPE30141.1 Cytochrome P450 [Glarea lozoyensis ATCC 20868]